MLACRVSNVKCLRTVREHSEEYKIHLVWATPRYFKTELSTNDKWIFQMREKKKHLT